MSKTITSHKMEFPIPRTHCGVAMGNGNLGALVWGIENLNITLNRADFWDHRGGEVIMEGNSYKRVLAAIDPNDGNAVNRAFLRKEFPKDVFKSQRVPFGRFEFAPKKGVKFASAELIYKSGELTVAAESGEKIKISCGVDKNAMIIDDPDGIIASVITKPSWEFEKAKEWLSTYAFKPPKLLKEKTLCGWAQSCPEDPSLAAVCVKDGKKYAIALELGADDANALSAARASAEKLLPDTKSFLKKNADWWKDYWRDFTEINMPDEFYNQFFKYAAYKFACAANPNSSHPACLQGPWVEEYKRAEWSADYHFNVNIQQIYTLGFGIGRLEFFKPLFDMVESDIFMKNMRHNAKVMFGIDDGLLLTHAVDDRGFQCGWISCGSVLDHCCGAWLAQLYWFYYKHTLDKDFLRNRAYPFIKGIMRVYEAMLEKKNGKLSIPLAISAEYGCRNPNGAVAGRDPSYQLAGIHMLLSFLFEASEILGVEPKPFWREMKEKVPPYTLYDGHDLYKNPEKRIALWEKQDLEYCHRHHSHLACVYPFDTLGLTDDPEKDNILQNTLDNWVHKGMGEWSEWCLPWAAIIQTRVGFNEAPFILMTMWREIFVNEGMATAYLPRFRGLTVHRRSDMVKPKETNEIMQLDGTMGGATAMMEMLAHTHSGATNVFQGIPSKWRDVSFKNINLPGPFRISASKAKGKVEDVTVESLGGEKFTLNVFGLEKIKMLKGKAWREVSLPLTLKMKKGETAKFSEI